MEIKEQTKYEQALSQYNCELNDADIKAKVREIIATKVPENDTLDVKKFLFGSIELTTLKPTDSDVSVMAFTERVNAFDNEYPNLPHVATICVYPCFAEIVKDTLEVDGVEIACVSGSFPSSQARIEVKVAETARDRRKFLTLTNSCKAPNGQTPEQNTLPKSKANTMGRRNTKSTYQGR